MPEFIEGLESEIAFAPEKEQVVDENIESYAECAWEECDDEYDEEDYAECCMKEQEEGYSDVGKKAAYDDSIDDFDEMDVASSRDDWDYTDKEIQQLMDMDTYEVSYGITEKEALERNDPEKTEEKERRADEALAMKIGDRYESSSDWKYSEEDIQQLSEDILSAENNGLRNSYWVDNEGIHHDDWKDDAVEGTEQEVQLQPGMLLERHSKKGVEEDKGTYLAPYGTKFEDKQLNYTEDAYDKNYYVINQPIQVLQSKVGDQGWQPWNLALQYKLQDGCVHDLLDAGVLSEISPEEAKKLIVQNNQKN